MGGRGASSGVSVKGKRYGTEYKAVLEYKNVKFIKYLGDRKTSKPATTPPMEAMTKGRVYVTINGENRIKSITFYDKNNLRKSRSTLLVNHIILMGLPNYHIHI